MEPLVSVVIPAFNAAPYVSRAIESVLAQTHRAVELIVVDDGSSDATYEVAGRFGSAVACIRQANRGVSSARNRGATDASGDLFAFLDADDEWLPRKLEVQLARLAARPEAIASFTNSVAVDERTGSERSLPYQLEPDMERNLLVKGPLIGNASSVLLRRGAFEAVGGFDEELSQSADYDLWLRLAGRGEFDYLPEVLVRLHVREGSMSSSVPLLERDTRRVLDKFFADPAGAARCARDRGRAYGNALTMLSGSYLHAGDLRSSLRCLSEAVLRHPASLAVPVGLLARGLRRRSVR